MLQSCQVNLTKEAHSSPSGEYKAELIENDTGAPGPFISIVSISQVRPDLITRLLRHRRETVFGVELSAKHVSFQWSGINDLLANCGKCDASKILVRKPFWKDVRVTYKIYPDVPSQ